MIYLLPSMSGGIIKGKLCDPPGLFPRDHLEALHHPSNGLVLQSGVLSLRLLTDDHHVNAGVARFHPWQAADLHSSQ